VVVSFERLKNCNGILLYFFVWALALPDLLLLPLPLSLSSLNSSRHLFQDEEDHKVKGKVSEEIMRIQ